jgi:hypothetical protein
MVVGKVVAHLCLTLIIVLKFSVEHDRVVTTLNIIFSVVYLTLVNLGSMMQYLGILYIKDHTVLSCQMAFFHGHTSWSHFMVISFQLQVLKPSSSSLGVIGTWTKRSDHAPKSGYVDFYNVPHKTQL